jgi:hypothetical protein
LAKRPLGVYLSILWGVIIIGVDFFYLIASALYLNPANVIGVVLTIISVIGLWMMKKWGAALTIVFNAMLLASSIIELQLAYYYPQNAEQMINLGIFILHPQTVPLEYLLDVVVSVLVLIYMFSKVYKGIFT